MSIDDTARTVWNTKKPPLALLVAGRATRMLAEPLPEEARAELAALTSALESWWPKKQRSPQDIYAVEFAACLARFDARTSEAPTPAMTGAYVQMAAFLKLAPKSLPGDGFYGVDEDDFVKLLRDGAKASRLPLAQLDKRLRYLLEIPPRTKWPDLVARVERMHWGASAPWGKLDKRVHELASLADLGAAWSWSKVGNQDALRLELDDVKRIAVLSADDLETLSAVVPAIEPPPS